MRLKILIIEDNLNNLYLMELLLKHAGFLTLSATNGAQGVDAAKRERPDLILMDIQMPVMDGFATTGLLKQDPTTKDIPVIGVSSFATAQSRNQGLNVGMSAYIEKPIDPENFIAQIKPYLP